MDNKMREAFEAWIKTYDVNPPLERYYEEETGEWYYEESYTQRSWMGWQAALASADRGKGQDGSVTDYGSIKQEPKAVLCREIGETSWLEHVPVKPGSARHKYLTQAPEWDTCEVYTHPSPAQDSNLSVGSWNGQELTKSRAIEIIERLTDGEDPHWLDNVVGDFYCEETDSWPSIYDVFAALGITEDEYKAATGAENVKWPDVPASAAPCVAKPAQQPDSQRVGTVGNCFGPDSRGLYRIAVYSSSPLDVGKVVFSHTEQPLAMVADTPHGQLQFVGYTNGAQILYANDVNFGGEGSFYKDTDHECCIPLYMLKTHWHRLESTTDGDVTLARIRGLQRPEVPESE